MSFRDMQKMMKQVQKMQQEMARVQEELGNLTVEGSAGGKAVTVVANGHGEIREVRISPEVVDPEEIEMLQDLIVAAVNQALTQAKERAALEMGKVTAGLNLPGLPGIPGLPGL